jgi:hypothetical protein
MRGMIQSLIIDCDDCDADAGARHSPYSCPSQLLEAERHVYDANKACHVQGLSG